MNFIKRLLVAISLTLSRETRLYPEQSLEHTTEQEEPQPERDEWNRMLHHDDVNPYERVLLGSDDPKDIKAARDAIFQREAEFQEWWDDKETRNKAFYGEYSEQIASGVKAVPIRELDGWEDDEMPEYYETVVRIGGSDKGKVVKVPFEIGEKLGVSLGPGEDRDQQFGYMHAFLVEVYNREGCLVEDDYREAQYQWDKLVAEDTVW